MPSIQSFFERYAGAHSPFDAEALLPFFDWPCMIIDDLGDHVMVEEDDLLRYERPFLARLAKGGIRAVSAKLLTKRMWETSSCACSVRYHFDDRHRTRLGDVEYHYVLIRHLEDWRIKLARSGRVHAWAL